MINLWLPTFFFQWHFYGETLEECHTQINLWLLLWSPEQGTKSNGILSTIDKSHVKREGAASMEANIFTDHVTSMHCFLPCNRQPQLMMCPQWLPHLTTIWLTSIGTTCTWWQSSPLKVCTWHLVSWLTNFMYLASCSMTDSSAHLYI